jgi:hypothetical protein
MRIQHGDNCVSKIKVGEWLETFEGNRTRVVDDECFVRPLTVTCVGIG